MISKTIRPLICLSTLFLGAASSIQAQQSPQLLPTLTPETPREITVQDERVDLLMQQMEVLQQQLATKAEKEELQGLSGITSQVSEQVTGMNQQITTLKGSVGENRSALSTVGSNMRPADVIWISICAALVFFMQPGFCLLELGFSRSKNVINVIMKNFVDFCVASIGFILVGFGLMHGASVAGFFGSSDFFLLNGAGDDGVWVFLIYQMMFVGTAATIASGAMAERTKFVGYIMFSIVLSTLIYPITGHWGWGGSYGGTDYGQGWLAALGFVDFAGSTIVHTVGGACALAGVIVLGPRVGRFAADGSPRLIVGHNLPFAALGTFMLWFCWFGFNGGSILVADGYIGRILVNTNLAAAAGGLLAMLSMWRVEGRPDLAITLNGALGGLVAITASCNAVTPGSAILIGIVAGLLATMGAVLLEKLKIDDVVGAVPVHLINGIWGTVALALFAESGFSISAVGIQLLGALTCSVFAFVMSFILFKVVDKTIGLRVSETEQIEGLDFHEHAATAYPDFTTTDQTL